MSRDRTWEFSSPVVGLSCPTCHRPLPAPARKVVVLAPTWFDAVAEAARMLGVEPDALTIVGHT